LYNIDDYARFLQSVYGKIGIYVTVNSTNDTVSYRIGNDGAEHKYYYAELCGETYLVQKIEGDEEQFIWRFDAGCEYRWWYLRYEKLNKKE
jgi:hypothetical protein